MYVEESKSRRVEELRSRTPVVLRDALVHHPRRARSAFAGRLTSSVAVQLVDDRLDQGLVDVRRIPYFFDGLGLSAPRDDRGIAEDRCRQLSFGSDEGDGVGFL